MAHDPSGCCLSPAFCGRTYDDDGMTSARAIELACGDFTSRARRVVALALGNELIATGRQLDVTVITCSALKRTRSTGAK